MKDRSILLVLCTVIACRTAGIAAAQETRSLRVIVTSTSGNDLFLDKGRADGIVAGMDVTLFPDGKSPIVAVVRAVTSSSARVELPPGVESPPIGTQGEVRIPGPTADVETGEPPPDEAPPRTAPEHPPWTRDISVVDPNAPLLAPVHRTDPRTRPMTFTGRTYFSGLYTHDTGGDRSNDYLTARLGLSVTVGNPLGRGGRVRFDTEVDHHHASIGSGSSSSDSEWRIERLSYAEGGEDFSSYRLEVGRFYSIYLPELGLIDGVEGALRFEHGLSAGAGVGLLPENDTDRGWDGDVGAHIFLSYESEEPDRASGVIGYQKTWHDGEEDRDQIILRANWRPTNQLYFYGSIIADVYTNRDTIKGSGIEITQFWTQLRYTPTSSFGGSVSYSRFTWPEVLREDYVSIPIQIIEDGVVDRVSFSAWGQLSEAFLLTGDFDLWQDQDTDGSSGDLSLEWSGFGLAGPTLEGTIFYTDGSFNSGTGFRIDARQRFEVFDASIGYELFDYDLVTGFVSDEAVLRHLMRGGISWNSGPWYYNFTGDYYFGDVDDVITIGAYVSYRF